MGSDPMTFGIMEKLEIPTKIKEMDLTAASEEFNFYMDKDTDYYIYLGGVKGRCGGSLESIFSTIYI